MLALLGTLGLIQALVLPGYVAARALGIRGAARLAAASVALGLPLQFALAAILVRFGAFRRGPLIVLAGVEIALAAWLAHRARRSPAAATGDGGHGPSITLAEGGAGLAALALAAWLVGRVARASRGIFSGWDDVASWNHWAMEWFRGTFPAHTWNYPQGLPVAWATTYAWMGTDLVQSIARGMMPLFALAAMLALAGSPGARLRGLASAWFAGMFLARVNNVTAGLADVPVACAAAVAMAEWLRAAPGAAAEGRGVASPAARIGLLSGAAALVKQAGLYLVLALPALHAAREPRGRRLRAALLGGGLAAVVACAWYLPRQLDIAAGRETSEVAHVLTAAHASLDPLTRARGGLARLASLAGGAPVLLALAGLALAGLRDRAVRPLVLGVALPFSALWLFGFSYDPRNLSLALPAWALACGAGLASIPGLGSGPRFVLPRVPRGARLVSALAALAGIAVLAFAVPDAKLLAHQRRLQRGLGDAEVAGALADLRDAGRLGGRIVADPGTLLAYAPGWESSFVLAPPADTAAWRRAVARADVAWVLAPTVAEAGPPGPGDWTLERRLARAALWRRTD